MSKSRAQHKTTDRFQGFCCSCEDAHRAESFRSVAAKSNYYQRDDAANRARNRSVSSANLFDNSEARRQVETNGNGEHDRRRVGYGDARGRVTSRNTSAVNGPLGERASPLREQQKEEQLKNNSARRRTRPLEGLPRAGSANREEVLPSVLKNVFSDPSPSKGKIEAYIDAVYEQAMKERAMKQAIKQESDRRNKDLLGESDLSAGSTSNSRSRFQESGRRFFDRRISDGRSSIYGPEFSQQFLDHRNDGRSLIRGSVADDPRNPTTRPTRLVGEQGSAKTDGEEDNREFLEKCDRSVNFSESGNRQETVGDRFRGAAHPENTFDYTPTMSPAIHPSRIPEESQFSRRTEKNAFVNGDNASPDNGSFFPTTIEFFIRSGLVPCGDNSDENINYGVASPTIKSNGFEEGVFALLSKIVISETRSSTVGEAGQRGFRASSENISGNVNALRNAWVVRKNLSAAAIRRGNTSGEERKTENANVSTGISAVPAFTRLRNLSSSSSSSSVGISRLEELSAPVVAARSADKSLTKIPESKTRGSLSANETRRFPDDLVGDLHEGRESRGMYSSPERAPQDVNLKNSYKFWKTRRKFRKSKGADKFRGDKGVGRGWKQPGKSSRGLTRKRASPDLKRDNFRDKFPKRERRFRRHLHTGREVFNILDARGRSNGLTGEGSRRKARVFTDYYTRPEVARYRRETSSIAGDKNPRKQVILESGHRKVQSGENDNPFDLDNKDSRKNSVDKRIEDKFVRISNVLKEDSTEARIIQETPGNFEVVTKSEAAKADIPKIQNELGENLFSRESGKSGGSLAIHGDEIPHGQHAELIDTRQRSTANENSHAITESRAVNNEVTTITSLITRKDSTDCKGSVFLKLMVGPSPPTSITEKLDYDVSREINFKFDKSKNPIYASEFATRQTEVFVQALSSNAPRGENVDGCFEITGEPLGTLSGSWASSSKEATSPEAANNHSEGERDETENARFHELNNNSSRMIAGNSVEPEGPPIDRALSPRGSVSVTEPEGVSLRLNKEEISSRYTENPLPENSKGFPGRSREREEIAELVDRIVRQYATYTPVMPDMPNFDEITEAGTLPPVEETTVTQFTTTLATTTRITDVAFRPSMRPLRTTPLPGQEMHDEISLDETTFVEETEATTTSRETTVSKPRPERPKASTSSRAKIRRVSNKTERNGKRRQKIANRVTGMKMTDVEKKVETHPWYRTTEVQQIIAANRSVQKIEGGKKKHRYKSKTDSFQSTSPSWTSSTTVSSGVGQTRGKRSDFIRAAGDRDSLIFYDYEGEEDEGVRRSGRTSLNKNEKSPNITEPTELRSRIEKRLTGELDYPASRGSSRHSCESRDQTQKPNAALRDIVARNVGLRIAGDDLDSSAQEKERDMQDNLKNFTVLKLKDDAVRTFDKDVSSRDREAMSVSFGIPPSDPSAKVSRTDLSGSVRERLELDRGTEKRGTFGERMVAEIDRVAVVRKIAVDMSGSARSPAGAAAGAAAGDLSDRRGAESPGKSSAGGILPAGSARSPGNRDKSRETDTVIRGVKLMMPGDKGETRELDVAAKSTGKKIPPSFAAARRQRRGREDARKINENPADIRARRVSAGVRYHRRSRDKVYNVVRKIINKIEGKSSVSDDEADTEVGFAGSEKRAVRSSPDWHRSGGRRLLSSSGGSDRVASIDDEYYANDARETDRENDASDNEAIARRRDDLSYLAENPPGRREDRDPRKLVAETDRLADASADAARTVMPKERTVAVCDAAVLSDDVQANSEEAISSSNYRNKKKKVKKKNTDSQERPRDIEVVLESTDPASYNDDKTLKVPLEAEESIIQRVVDNNNNPVQEKSFDSKDVLRNSRTYGEIINEEPFSLREAINENNSQDESLYETQSIFNRETTSFPATSSRNPSSAGRMLSNVDLSSSSAAPKNEGGIKISLIGRIQVHGGFNQTPVLISLDAVPDGFSTTQSSVSAGSSNTIKVIETTAINPPLNDSNAEFTFDLMSVNERANDEASDSLNTISDESQEAGKSNVIDLTLRSREKLFDLTGRSAEERKTTEKNPSRLEKRLDKYNANTKSAKQVFLTDHSAESNDEVARPNGEMISERNGAGGGSIDKLDSRSSANPVYFPDILGSVLVNNDSLKDQDVNEPPRRIETNRSSSTETADLSNTTLHVVPLMRIDVANDGRTGTTCCPWNATSGGCYRMPATVRKLEITVTTPRELLTSSNYRDGDPAETFSPGLRETTADDRSAVTTKSSPSTRLQNDVLETATERTTNETRSTATPCGRGNGRSINAIRARSMMTIVRFMMKLLRIIAEEDEEPPCSKTPIGETVIHVENVVINASSHVERQGSTTDRAIIKSGRTRQDLTSAEWRSTAITERIREKSSTLGDGTFESFTEAPSSYPAASTLPSSPDEVPEDEKLPSTLFETSTGREVYTSTLSSTISSATPRSFLFYEPARKSHRKGFPSRKDTGVDLTGVKQNSSVSFKGSKDESGGKKSRLDDGQASRSSSRRRDQNRSSVERFHLGKQGIATTNPEDKIGSRRAGYLARSKNAGSGSTGVANDTVRRILPRDIDVSRGALLERVGAARENRPERSKSEGAGVSDRRAETRTKLLNRSARGGPAGDWIGEHRAATRRLSIDKKLRELRKVPGGTPTPGKVVFRRVRGKINRPPDPNLVSGRSDSFKIEGNVAGNGPLAKLSTDDALSVVGGGLSSLEREDAAGNAIGYSSTSSLANDNVGASGIGEEIVDERARFVTKKHISNKKRDVSERRDFRKGNRAFRKRQRAASPTKRKTKRKKKRKKGGQRTKDISETAENLQRRFKRHLLMMSLEPEYDADDAAARFSRRHVATEGRNAENLRKSAGSSARVRRRGRDGDDRTVDGPETDPGTAQIRGGQDCTDRRHPPNIDAAKYLESAHCLRFSDLWYSVYQLEDPIVEHAVYLQVYEKRALANGSTYWEDLTADSVVRSFMPSDWARSTGTIEAAKIRSLSPTRK
ncbi:PREDICTED: uncharacterized protein LOC105451295 [Wasmannia auropunctata]|uniref:uncharacterized protein LOC105451295 n=1 Tax=Wasmannia auropunctata TaxID=64793 RepID=UPI0005EF3AF3|nr:PREDICTED: uncharacterized protein LOC105451295 [Wasmannia auropunctata]